MHVEADFFRVAGPVLVAEAVGVFAVVLGVEAVVAGRDGGLVDEVRVCGV